LEKYKKFYVYLGELIKKIPASKQSIDEHITVLKQITHILQTLLVTIPKQCDLLPLADLQEATELLQQRELGTKYDETAVTAKSLVEIV